MNRAYKKSIFNIARRQEDGNVILYNSYTGAIILLNENAYKQFEENQLEDFEALYKHGFLVEITTDELSEVAKMREKAVQDEQGIFRVTIAPTMACNARCFYCFEKDAPIYTMTEEIANQTIKFIRQQSKDKNLAVHWFGGEPLLIPNIIDMISRELKSTIGTKKYFASIATNASLINDEMVGKLSEWNVDFVQVTIDGTEREYIKRKAYVNKIPNQYEQIMQNMEKMLENGVFVKVRINFDRENLQEAKELIEELTKRFKRRYKRFSVYVFPLLGSCDAQNLFKADELEEPMKELYSELFKHGYITSFQGLNLNPRNIHCGARKPNSFNIDPLGNLIKCEHHIGRKEFNVGSVFDGICKNDIYKSWVTSDVDAKCSLCPILPVCQGGCAVNINSNAGNCSILRSNLGTLLDMAYKIYLGRRN